MPLAISLEPCQGIPAEGLTLIASHFTQLKIVGEIPLTSVVPITYVYLEVSFVLLTAIYKNRDFYSEHHDQKKKKRNKIQGSGEFEKHVFCSVGVLA